MMNVDATQIIDMLPFGDSAVGRIELQFLMEHRTHDIEWSVTVPEAARLLKWN